MNKSNPKIPSSLKHSVFYAALACLFVSNAWAGDLAIKAGKIIPVVGEPIENGIIIIRDGKITEMGSDIEIPVELPVVAAEDGVVVPGIIDAHSPSAMSQANENNPLVPFLSVVDSIDPSLSYFESCRRNGITTSSVVPGNSTVIGGQTAIIKTAGGYVDDMLLQRVSGMKISLQPRSGSRMTHLSQLRRELDKAVRAIEKEKEAEKEKSKKKEDSKKSDKEKDSKESDSKAEKSKDDSKDADTDKKPSNSEKSDTDKSDKKAKEDAGLAAMKKVVSGKLPVFIYCSSPMDISTAKRLRSKYGLDLIFVLSASCYKAANELADEQRPVIIDPRMVFWQTDPRTREDEKIVIPEILREADVEFVVSLQNGGGFAAYGSDYPWYQAALCVKYGMEVNEALAAMTLEPAKALGIDKFVGSLEVGKDGDVVVLTGDPLSANTWVETTIVGGEVVYERDKDDKIQKLLEPAAE